MVKAGCELSCARRKPLPVALPSSWPQPLGCRAGCAILWAAGSQRQESLATKQEQGKTYLSFTVNCTPVFRTSGLWGWVGMQGCLSTTKELWEEQIKGTRIYLCCSYIRNHIKVDFKRMLIYQ